jgi:hypothetical protein
VGRRTGRGESRRRWRVWLVAGAVLVAAGSRAIRRGTTVQGDSPREASPRPVTPRFDGGLASRTSSLPAPGRRASRDLGRLGGVAGLRIRQTVLFVAVFVPTIPLIGFAITRVASRVLGSWDSLDEISFAITVAWASLWASWAVKHHVGRRLQTWLTIEVSTALGLFAWSAFRVGGSVIALAALLCGLAVAAAASLHTLRDSFPRASRQAQLFGVTAALVGAVTCIALAATGNTPMPPGASPVEVAVVVAGIPSLLVAARAAMRGGVAAGGLDVDGRLVREQQSSQPVRAAQANGAPAPAPSSAATARTRSRFAHLARIADIMSDHAALFISAALVAHLVVGPVAEGLFGVSASDGFTVAAALLASWVAVHHVSWLPNWLTSAAAILLGRFAWWLTELGGGFTLAVAAFVAGFAVAVAASLPGLRQSFPRASRQAWLCAMAGVFLAAAACVGLIATAMAPPPGFSPGEPGELALVAEDPDQLSATLRVQPRLDANCTGTTDYVLTVRRRDGATDKFLPLVAYAVAYKDLWKTGAGSLTEVSYTSQGSGSVRSFRSCWVKLPALGGRLAVGEATKELAAPARPVPIAIVIVRTENLEVDVGASIPAADGSRRWACPEAPDAPVAEEGCRVVAVMRWYDQGTWQTMLLLVAGALLGLGLQVVWSARDVASTAAR